MPGKAGKSPPHFWEAVAPRPLVPTGKAGKKKLTSLHATMCRHAYVSVHACMSAACLRVCVHACMHTHVALRVSVHACVRVCMHAWVGACVCASMCVHACAHA